MCHFVFSFHYLLEFILFQQCYMFVQTMSTSFFGLHKAQTKEKSSELCYLNKANINSIILQVT